MSIFTNDEPDFFLDNEDSAADVHSPQPLTRTSNPNPPQQPAAPSSRVINFDTDSSIPSNDDFSNCDYLDQTCDYDGDDTDDYFLSSESTPRDSLPHKSHLSRYIILTISLFIILAAIAYLRYFTPYVSGRHKQVYVTAIEKRGLIFPTYEARIVEIKQSPDSLSTYQPSTEVSVADQALARTMMQAAASHTPVTIVCNLYHGSIPWRGSSLTLVTGVE